MIGWDDPRTATAYAAFDAAHDRYAAASRTVVRHARIRTADRVLDLAAGLGGTAVAVLSRLGPTGRVVCFEPAGAMRALGAHRVTDDRVRWVGTLAPRAAVFDRVVCSAAMWLLQPLDGTLDALRRLLVPGGVLSFNVPALYLGEPDVPGGGADPLLHRLPAEVAGGRVLRGEAGAVMGVSEIEEALATAGFRVRRWRWRFPLTQPMLRDWMKIPVVTDPLLTPLDPAERAARIDAAYGRCDPASWRWERWIGWTAERRVPRG